MFAMIFGNLAVAIIGVVFIMIAESDFDSVILGVVGIVLSIVGAIGFFCGGIIYFDAKHSSEFINQQYGTHYTTEQFFWNGDDIKSMVIGKYNRIKIEK